jgi:hypothetical protein
MVALCVIFSFVAQIFIKNSLHSTVIEDAANQTEALESFAREFSARLVFSLFFKLFRHFCPNVSFCVHKEI